MTTTPSNFELIETGPEGRGWRFWDAERDLYRDVPAHVAATEQQARVIAAWVAAREDFAFEEGAATGRDYMARKFRELIGAAEKEAR